MSWVNWLAGVTAVYAAVFGVGEFLTGSPTRGALECCLAVGAFLLIQRNLRADEGLLASVDTALDPRSIGRGRVTFTSSRTHGRSSA